MAQVTLTDKRTSMNSHGRTQHSSPARQSSRAKENIAKHSTKGIEILDFHESWLEEVEVYKDKMVVCKQYPHHHLGSHNRVLTQHGCQIDGTKRIAGGTGNGIVAKVITGGAEASINGNTNGSAGAKHGTDKVNAASLRKPRVVIRGAPKANNVATVSTVIHSEPYKKVQMLLKRAREEVYVKHSNGSKRAHTQSRHHHNSNRSHGQNTAKTGNGSANNNGGGNGTSSNHAATTSQSNKTGTSSSAHASISNTANLSSVGGAGGTSSSAITLKAANNKIVVNTFHASSLLSAQHHDDKTNFLTQNGLTKSAANALETSLYASIYANGNNTTAYYNSMRLNSGDNYNYLGVSMNKPNERRASTSQAEDDPCAAIDEVNNYDDSDSEEDYSGCPFYLEEDGTETHQSRNIHNQQTQPESDTTSKVSVDTMESENSLYYKPTTILSASLFPNVPPYLNFTSHADKGPSMPAALHRVLKWKLSPVMPKIVKRVVLNSGFRIIKNTTDWMAVWEKHMKSPGFRTIRSHQKYNHIPGSFRIGRKDTMWRSIYNNMKKFGKKEFGFMQKSYIMPDDLENLRQVWPKNASKLAKWIVKPPASARGTGIRIVNKWSQFPKDRPLVVQKYIERPLLINDNKFDMRLYVVLTSINPLRIYMYKDGLARFASVKYSSELSNLDERCMHLTNYSINKFSQNYAKNEDFNACQGHKWTLQSLWSCLENRGVNTKRLWATLRNLVIKAIISGESGLNRMYRQNVNFRYNCFELFGFDVLLDENLIPWLLEINISPSLHSELPLDLHVKGPLIQAVLNTALYQVPPKLNEKQQRDILDELELSGPLCHDKRIFTTCLTAEEVRKHNQYTNRSIEFREEYIDTILDNLLPDDVRCLVVSEDELARCKPLERIFPTNETHIYLRFVENPRYYNRLLDAWEHKYAQDRAKGLGILKKLCAEGYHLQVSDAAMEKEPNVALTEIDMLHVKKDEVIDSATNLSLLTNTTITSNTGDAASTGTRDLSIGGGLKWKLDSKADNKQHGEGHTISTA